MMIEAPLLFIDQLHSSDLPQLIVSENRKSTRTVSFLQAMSDEDFLHSVVLSVLPPRDDNQARKLVTVWSPSAVPFLLKLWKIVTERIPFARLWVVDSRYAYRCREEGLPDPISTIRSCALVASAGGPICVNENVAAVWSAIAGERDLSKLPFARELSFFADCQSDNIRSVLLEIGDPRWYLSETANARYRYDYLFSSFGLSMPGASKVPVSDKTSRLRSAIVDCWYHPLEYGRDTPPGVFELISASECLHHADKYFRSDVRAACRRLLEFLMRVWHVSLYHDVSGFVHVRDFFTPERFFRRSGMLEAWRRHMCDPIAQNE